AKTETKVIRISRPQNSWLPVCRTSRNGNLHLGLRQVNVQVGDLCGSPFTPHRIATPRLHCNKQDTIGKVVTRVVVGNAAGGWLRRASSREKANRCSIK